MKRSQNKRNTVANSKQPKWDADFYESEENKATLLARNKKPLYACELVTHRALKTRPLNNNKHWGIFDSSAPEEDIYWIYFGDLFGEAGLWGFVHIYLFFAHKLSPLLETKKTTKQQTVGNI